MGFSAGLLLYLWQRNIEISVAAFIIVAHASSVAVHCHRSAVLDLGLRRDLAAMAINAPGQRAWRLLIDPYFWWSLGFGIGSITFACWFAGLKGATPLMLVALCWAIISVVMGYDLTLQYPTTRCRKCGYQLIGQLDQSDPGQRLRCPECGRQWTKSQLCLVPVGWSQTPVVVSPAAEAEHMSNDKPARRKRGRRPRRRRVRKAA